ncbi:MAG: hypothetical protein WBF37_05160 [Dehalococcoidia bacterium]
MSKLAEKIRRVTMGEPTPIGFGAAGRARTATMLLLGLAADRWAERASQAASGGVDALILAFGDGALKKGELQDAVKAAGDMPCGVQLGQADPEVIERLREAGVDFVVFEAERTTAASLLGETLGYVLHLREEMSDVYLRTLEPLPLDAILLPSPEGSLTVRAQMELQRVAGLARTSLIVTVPPSTGPAELQCLRDVGVAGVAVDLGLPGGVEALPALRQGIEGLPAHRRRREEHWESLLPSMAPQAAEEEEEE